MRICSTLLSLAHARLTADNVRGDLSPSDAAAIISADALSRLADAFEKITNEEVPPMIDFSKILEEDVTDADADAAMSEEKIELAEPESEPGLPTPESVPVTLGVNDEAPEEPATDTPTDPGESKVVDDEIIVPAPTRKSRTAL